MLDDATVLLTGARHETWDIDKRNHGDIEGIAETHKARRFDGALDVQATRQHQRLVGDDANGLSVHTGKTNQDVFRVLGLQLKEIAIVHHLGNEFVHVIRLVGVVRYEGV